MTQFQGKIKPCWGWFWEMKTWYYDTWHINLSSCPQIIKSDLLIMNDIDLETLSQSSLELPKKLFFTEIATFLAI